MFENRAFDGMVPLHAGAAVPGDMSGMGVGHHPTRVRYARSHGLADRYSSWKRQLSNRIAAIDLAPDLARDIGSRRWMRGAATLIGLSALALAAWPDFSAVAAAPASSFDSDVRDEFRSQMIMPLALGADSGRRMGATNAVVQLANAPERPNLDLASTLARGDSFDRMLRRAGVGEAEAGQIAGLIASAIPLADIPAGTQVDITLGRRPTADAPRPLDALSFRARFDLQLAVERQDGRLRLIPKPIRVDTTPLRIRGVVGSSLYRSARAAGAPASAVQQYLRAIGAEMDIESGIASRDEFDIIVDYKRAATGEVEAGRLLFAGLTRDGKPRKQLLRWGADGRFYEASGVGEMRQGLIAPVPGQVSSNFGMRRHPILGYKRMHRGMDFRAGHGTPIYAVTDGVVQFAGRSGGYGNFVKLGHNAGLATGYAHMSRIAVRSGQSVRRGQVIGYVGSTGLSTGPHLHYEMYRNGVPVNPASVRFVTRAQLSGSQLSAFRAQLAQLQRITPGAALNSLEQDSAVVEDRPLREIDRLERRQASN